MKRNYTMTEEGMKKQYIRMLLVQNPLLFKQAKQVSLYFGMAIILFVAMLFDASADVWVFPVILAVLGLAFLAAHVMFLGDHFAKKNFEKRAEKYWQTYGAKMEEETLEVEFLEGEVRSKDRLSSTTYSPEALNRAHFFKDGVLIERMNSSCYFFPLDSEEGDQELEDWLLRHDVEVVQHPNWDWKTNPEV